MLDWLLGRTRNRSAAPQAEAETLQTRDLMAREMHLRAETVDEQQRSVEAVIATENQVPVFDMSRMEVIDEVLLMDGVQIPRQIPMLDNHMRFSLHTHLGSIRNIRVESNVQMAGGETLDRALIGRLFFAGGEAIPEAERAWQLVKDGHLTDVSTGNRALAATQIEPGESETINGRTFTAGNRPLQVTQQWRPREGSLTSVGADQESRVRGDNPPASATQKPGEKVSVNGHAISAGIADAASKTRSWEQIETELCEATELNRKQLDKLLDAHQDKVRRDDLEVMAAIIGTDTDQLIAKE